MPTQPGRNQRARLLAYFNHLWERGTLPESFTRAYVFPILKRGKPPDELGSYWPISSTSAVGKLPEMMMLDRMEWLAGEHGWSPEQQVGYRRGRSTAHCITDVVSTFEQAKGSKYIMFLVLLDVEKAFDALPDATIHAALDRCRVMRRMRTCIPGRLSVQRQPLGARGKNAQLGSPRHGRRAPGKRALPLSLQSGPCNPSQRTSHNTHCSNVHDALRG